MPEFATQGRRRRGGGGGGEEGEEEEKEGEERKEEEEEKEAWQGQARPGGTTQGCTTQAGTRG